MTRLEAHGAEELVSVQEIAAALDMGESTVWLLAKRHTLPRYRIAARGKTTLFKWRDVVGAYTRPMPAEPRQETGKAAA